jgi:hypothetical protein
MSDSSIINPLPAIIQEVPRLVLNAVNHEPHYEAKLDLEIKKIILCVTKDLKPEDLALLSDYKVVEYDDNTHKNIPITAFAWDILVLDLREKGDRYCYMKEVQPVRHRYKVIAFVHGFEVDDVDIDCDNVLTSFPVRQARKEDFEMLLMMKRISKPKWWKSLFSCVLNFVHKVKN